MTFGKRVRVCGSFANVITVSVRLVYGLLAKFKIDCHQYLIQKFTVWFLERVSVDVLATLEASKVTTVDPVIATPPSGLNSDCGPDPAKAPIKFWPGAVEFRAL